ncbi:MAG: BatA domain-containing protein, partial [Flavobacteriales bacterium]|nr:BatA domain-containing protein [Flavobacteriales bacterium]
MSFVYPEFLFALAAISVPIIIHLFNFRRFKKIYFSDIRFLKNVEIETKSRNQLKNLLILLSRILAVAFLVLAFAQPVIPTSNTQSNGTSDKVVIYVDNSFSMNGTGETGTLLEEAISKALEIASVYANEAELRLLTNDFDPQHFRNLTFEEFKSEVTSVGPSPQVRTLEEVLSRAQGSINVGESLSIHLLSDLQSNTSSLENYTTDSLSTVYVIPVKPEIQSNIYIDSCVHAHVAPNSAAAYLGLSVAKSASCELQIINLRFLHHCNHN